MRKKFFLALLLTGSMVNLYAQQAGNTTNRFGIPASAVFNHVFMIDLGSSNQLEIQVTDAADLERIQNIDSIVLGFLKDLALLQDSLANPLSTKQIDYVADAFDRKKIHIRQSLPAGSSFLLDAGELALLRTGQDTINIAGEITNPPSAKQRQTKNVARYYLLSFYMNDYSDLKKISGAALNAKMETLIQNRNKRWLRDKALDQWVLKADKSVSAPWPAGVSGHSGDYLEFLGSANIQNYKNYFVPSFGLSIMFNFRNQQNKITTRFGLNWEYHFVFAKDGNSKLQTYRNDFLSLSFGRDSDKDAIGKGVELQSNVSLGYLIRRKGDYFENNTFKLGIGRLILKRTAIEPMIYFNDLFKGITPGIRITQFF